MSDTPIFAYRPKMVIQPLDADGDPDGAPVDVSCDVESVELSPEVPMNSQTTFCGTFDIPGDLEVSASISAVINNETLARWAPLVGESVQVQVKDKTTDTERRVFDSIVSFNPGLYGPTTPGEARAYDFDIPVLSEVTSESDS